MALLTSDEKIQVIHHFEKQCMDITHGRCEGCLCVSINLEVNKSGFCSHCSRKEDKLYYHSNKLHPIWHLDGCPQYHVPIELSDLSDAEKMLIQRVSPIIPLHHIKNGVFGLSGHVCAFEQDITDMATTLPRFGNEAGVVKVIQVIQAEIGNDKSASNRSFKVRRHAVLKALHWLKKHNRECFDIVIDSTRLNWINGNVGYLNDAVLRPTCMQTNKDNTPQNSDMGVAKRQCIDPRQSNDDFQAFGYVPDGGVGVISENDKLINDTLQTCLDESNCRGNVTMDWPQISNLPVNEFGSTRIFCRAFPWLFPGGYGDIIDMPNMNQNLSQWGKRMLHYQDGRFAKDKLFCFFAMNCIIRHRNASSGGFFVDKYSKDVPDTLNELKDLILEGKTDFTKHLTYYNKRIKGSSPYWFQKRSELYSWINQHIELGNGAPMYFMTLSCAEYFWPDVAAMLKQRLDLAGLDSSGCYVGSPTLVQLVNDYTVVIQEYFQKRVVTWLDTVGKKLFGIKHYWVRYEFAPGRGQTHAHLLAIPEDHSMHEAAYKVYQEDNGEAKRAQLLAEWAENKFGMTASLHPDKDRVPECSPEDPTTIRFLDISKDSESIFEDGQKLLQEVEIHECSGFCMREINRNQYVNGKLFSKCF